LSFTFIDLLLSLASKSLLQARANSVEPQW